MVRPYGSVLRAAPPFDGPSRARRIPPASPSPVLRAPRSLCLRPHRSGVPRSGRPQGDRRVPGGGRLAAAQAAGPAGFLGEDHDVVGRGHEAVEERYVVWADGLGAVVPGGDDDGQASAVGQDGLGEQRVRALRDAGDPYEWAGSGRRSGGGPAALYGPGARCPLSGPCALSPRSLFPSQPYSRVRQQAPDPVLGLPPARSAGCCTACHRCQGPSGHG